MIRAGEETDVPAIMALGRKFFDAAGWPAVAEWDDASVEATLRALIDGKMPGGLPVAEVDGEVVGMAAFLLFPFYFNLRTTVGQEIFWYVEEKHRFGAGAEMLQWIEAKAKEGGAAVFIMSSVTGLRDAALARVYARRGYAPAENTFIKRL